MRFVDANAAPQMDQSPHPAKATPNHIERNLSMFTPSPTQACRHHQSRVSLVIQKQPHI
jgi:hypothetical protein